MISLWKEVEKFEKRGDINKFIKVAVSDLVEIRENLIDFEWKAIKYEKKISELTMNQSSEMNINETKVNELGDIKKQDEIDDLKKVIGDLNRRNDALNHQISSLNAIVLLDQMGASDQGANITIDAEILERDVEIKKLQELLSDFEHNKGLRDSTIESQIHKMKKDAQAQAEILEFKNQELIGAQSKIESQKAELARNVAELKEERKKMSYDLALQKEASSTELNMQKSAMSKIETINQSLKDKIVQKDLEIDELNRVVTKFKFQKSPVDLTEITKRDAKIAQLQSSLKKAETIYFNNKNRGVESTQGYQKHQLSSSKLQREAVHPERRNQIVLRTKEKQSTIALFHQEYASMVRKTNQMKGIFQQDDKPKNQKIN